MMFNSKDNTIEDDANRMQRIIGHSDEGSKMPKYIVATEINYNKYLILINQVRNLVGSCIVA